MKFLKSLYLKLSNFGWPNSLSHVKIWDWILAKSLFFDSGWLDSSNLYIIMYFRYRPSVKIISCFGPFEILNRTHFSRFWLNSNPIWTFPFQLQKHTWNERRKTLKRGAKTVFTKITSFFQFWHQNIRFLMWDEVKMSQLKLFLCFEMSKNQMHQK